jgi:uncharacterized circularly permuted ATP-grasp superfamily protein
MAGESRFFDEMHGDGGEPRDPYAGYAAWIATEDLARLHRKAEEAEAFFRRTGITFNVYGAAEANERLIPFDLVPRIISAREWQRLSRGIEQRVRAINAFLHDIYHRQEILRAGRLPVELVSGNEAFLPQMIGVAPPGGVYTHIVGVDIVRTGEDEYFVLEDNARTPSGVSYMLENRETMLQMFPELFGKIPVQPVSDYPRQLRKSLGACAPAACTGKPVVVVLTPGIHNSAYFEHSFLARHMGIDLVEPSDLFVDGDVVFVRTTHGPRRVDVIYRRIDDAYLDPEFFRPDSLLGVAGLMRAYRTGNVALANAPGNGCADDKAVYPFVPDMVRYYLGEEPSLAQVDTYVCARDDDRKYVLEHLADLVVKSVDEAGGYGMLMGPQATREQRDEFRRRIEAEPRKYIAQHRIELSTCPTWDPAHERLAPRRVDLRPFILTRPEGVWVLPGGLTRVALVEGSYVVNSSQGGGSKDTWVERGGAP